MDLLILYSYWRNLVWIELSYQIILNFWRFTDLSFLIILKEQNKVIPLKTNINYITIIGGKNCTKI